MAELKSPLTITNFQGRLTRYNDGDINSGFAKYTTTFGNDPFTSPGNLTWFEQPTRIDSGGTIITDLIMASKTRLESGITYVYAIGHLGRLYKIQVNDPTTYNPNYDNPVLLAILTSNSPTFTRGASINFFGTSEQIYIGHDVGMTRINFDGTSESFVGVAGSWIATVPRPAIQFAQYLYVGNGNNLAQILAGGTVGSYAVLTPAFFSGTYTRDLDVSPDGNYLQATVSRINSPDLTSATQDTNSLSSADSYTFLWDGVVGGDNSGISTARTTYNSYSINSNLSFGDFSYTMGYDLASTAIYSRNQKIVTLNNSLSPNFQALFSTGNMLGFASPEQDASLLKGTLMLYGQYDSEIPAGLFRFFRQSAASPETNIIQIPYCGIVSNLFYGSSATGYTGNVVGSAKVYFSTLETSITPTTDYKLYKFTTVPTGLGTSMAGVYETQTQLFSKKVKVGQIRIYLEPLVANNAFTFELIGSNGGVISGSSKTFTAGTAPDTVGNDMCSYSPQCAPTYAIGVRITNVGSVNNLINKVEIDFTQAGI